ncbi:acyltransferase [Amylibacter sp.]|nr:acyltransferase [Amylibacter sp.]MDB4130263.1 acyltransferase [Amylibacter sp.]MDB9814405.1 acyltransferase [Amylibacter sp.]
MIKYRPEVDGLRALAIVPVVFFHANFSAFSGGFVGVDVFFVISGYLISSLILSDVAQGSFSFTSFYERRARRILPALFLVIACSMPFVWLLYLPNDMKDFSESVAAVPLFLSNFVFESQSGYFERATDIKPLIHTWSLAVEEQFYLFFPAVLLLLLRFGKVWMFCLIILLSILSLALAEWGTRHAPTDAYFLLPTRIWELLLGVLVAFYLFYQKQQCISDIGCLLGILMILVSIFIFDTETPFPGISALLPTIGTCLFILFAGPQTISFQIFSNRYVVLLGLISYSLYLWHQPIFAIVKYQSNENLSTSTSIMMIVISTILAFISWKYIEAPWRDASRVSNEKLTICGVVFSVFFITFGIIGSLMNGDLYRFNNETLAISNPTSGSSCPTPKVADGGCLIGDITKSPSIIVLGDSHARALTASLHVQMSKSGKTALLYASDWCPPLLKVDVSNDDEDNCGSTRDTAFSRTLSDPNITTIILHAEWANYTTGTRWGKRSLRFISDELTIHNSIDENQNVFARGINRTISRLIDANKQLIIVKSVPEYEVNVPNYLAIQFSKTGSLDADSFQVTQVVYDHRNKVVHEGFNESMQTPDLIFIDPFQLLCPFNLCQIVDANQRVLYNDGNHLSLAGANMLTPHIITSIK